MSAEEIKWAWGFEIDSNSKLALLAICDGASTEKLLLERMSLCGWDDHKCWCTVKYLVRTGLIIIDDGFYHPSMMVPWDGEQ